VEETEVPGENYRPVASHWQTLSHNDFQGNVQHLYTNDKPCGSSEYPREYQEPLFAESSHRGNCQALYASRCGGKPIYMTPQKCQY